jgi:F0F1-type ATP synthase assembly protein I
VDTDRRAESRALWNAFGNGFSHAFEIVMVPAVFALLGWWLDRIAGTRPALFIGFLTLGVIGTMARSYYTYVTRMSAQEKDKPWTRSRP